MLTILYLQCFPAVKSINKSQIQRFKSAELLNSYHWLK